MDGLEIALGRGFVSLCESAFARFAVYKLEICLPYCGLSAALYFPSLLYLLNSTRSSSFRLCLALYVLQNIRGPPRVDTSGLLLSSAVCGGWWRDRDAIPANAKMSQKTKAFL